MKRTALVTGANKNIGFAIAQQLAEAGLDVIVAARDERAGREAAARIAGARFVQLDITSPTSIAAAAASIADLDVLVNNAGISDPGDGDAAVTSIDSLRSTFEVNVFGTIAVTQALLPQLRRSASARIVNVSSSLGRAAMTSSVQLLGYRASKAALNMFTVALAQSLAGTSIKVNAAAPGFTLTDLNRNLAASQPNWTPPPHRQTVDDAAKVPVHLALLPDDAPSGALFDRTGQIAW